MLLRRKKERRRAKRRSPIRRLRPLSKPQLQSLKSRSLLPLQGAARFCFLLRFFLFQSGSGKNDPLTLAELDPRRESDREREQAFIYAVFHYPRLLAPKDSALGRYDRGEGIAPAHGPIRDRRPNWRVHCWARSTLRSRRSPASASRSPLRSVLCSTTFIRIRIPGRTRDCRWRVSAQRKSNAAPWATVRSRVGSCPNLRYFTPS